MNGLYLSNSDIIPLDLKVQPTIEDNIMHLKTIDAGRRAQTQRVIAKKQTLGGIYRSFLEEKKPLVDILKGTTSAVTSAVTGATQTPVALSRERETINSLIEREPSPVMKIMQYIAGAFRLKKIATDSGNNPQVVNEIDTIKNNAIDTVIRTSGDKLPAPIKSIGNDKLRIILLLDPSALVPYTNQEIIQHMTNSVGYVPTWADSIEILRGIKALGTDIISNIPAPPTPSTSTPPTPSTSAPSTSTPDTPIVLKNVTLHELMDKLGMDHSTATRVTVGVNSDPRRFKFKTISLNELLAKYSVNSVRNWLIKRYTPSPSGSGAFPTGSGLSGRTYVDASPEGLKKLAKRLLIIKGEIAAGNNSKSLRNETYEILDILLDRDIINEDEYYLISEKVLH